MYVSLSRLRVSAGRAEELIAAFCDRAHLVDDHDGFVDLEVWQSDHDETEFIMVSRWRDRDCFKRWARSPDHRASHDRVDPLLQGAIKLQRLEHLHTYQVVAR